MKSTRDKIWSTEDRVGRLVAPSGRRMTGYSERNRESPNYVRNSTPPDRQKRGVELIFHSFSSPPLHPSLHQSTRPSPPRPCAPSTIPCHTSPALSATSGRKLTIEKAPPATTPRLHPSCQNVQNLLVSLNFSSPKYHLPAHETVGYVRLPPYQEGRTKGLLSDLLSSS